MLFIYAKAADLLLSEGASTATLNIHSYSFEVQKDETELECPKFSVRSISLWGDTS